MTEGASVTVANGWVDVDGTLEYQSRQEAERAAWAAHGVTQVDDRLAVVP